MMLQLNDISKTFEETNVVTNMTLDLKEGEILALLGPSGCGKTTTLRMIAGLEHPSSGTIHIDEQLVFADGVFVPPEKRNIGMVFQSYALWPNKRVIENITYGLRKRNTPKDVAQKTAVDSLKLVDMVQYGQRFPSELSGGQQQRVSLARALASRPKLILFDEPLSNLDAKLRETMRFEIRDMHRRTGLTGVYVTHNQEEAFAIGDRVAVMNKGAVEQISTPEEIYNNPKNEFVASFVGLANIFSGTPAPSAATESVVTIAPEVRVRLSRAAAVSADGLVCFAVRPECITFSPGSDKANCLRGAVKDMIFTGSIVDYFIQCDGFQLRVQSPRQRSVAVGDSVQLFFEPRDTIVF